MRLSSLFDKTASKENEDNRPGAAIFERLKKGLKIAQNEKKNNDIRHVLYLRNGVTYDHDFWHLCKTISPGLFFIVLTFSFFGLLGG